MLLHWSRNFGSAPNCTTDEDNGDEGKYYNTSGTSSPTVPLLCRVSGTCRCISCWFSATLMTVRLNTKLRLLHQWGTIRLWHRLFLYIKLEPALWLGFGTNYRGWRLAQFKRKLLLSLWQRPVDMIVEVSLTWRKGILNIVKKGKMGSQDNTAWKLNKKIPSESCTEAIVSTRAVLVWEISCSVSKLA